LFPTLKKIKMKKLLLSVALLATSLGFSQALQSENFNGLTVGNLTTDITGATAGQGSWFTQSSNGTAPLQTFKLWLADIIVRMD
jgi:hypothetical protein